MRPNLHVISEARLILLAGLIQFVNILDFMMVMPLGPDFAKPLHIATSDIGLIGGSYTFSAAICGLISALFLDRYARKKAVLVCLVGLAFATFAGALVWNKESMVAAQTLSSKVPAPHERGAFLSVQSAITHFGSALGAYYSSLVLRESNHHLLNMPTVGFTSICLALLVLVLVVSLEQAIIDRGPAR